MFKVLGKSIWKGLKDTGRLVGSAALVAGLGVASDPTAMAAAWAALGPSAPIAVMVINFAARTALDAYKHRDQV